MLVLLIVICSTLVPDQEIPLTFPDRAVDSGEITDVSLLALEGYDSAWCDDSLSISGLIFNAGNVPVYEVEIHTTLEAGDGPESVIFWTGNLLPDDSIWIDLITFNSFFGSHLIEVEVVSVNQQIDDNGFNNLLTDEFYIFETDEITFSAPDTTCRGSEAFLKANLDGFGVLKWYDDPVAPVPLAFGNEFLTPPLTGNSVFYLDQIKKIRLGPENFMIGSSIFDTLNTEPVVFNVIRNINLVSVDVFAQSPGNRTIELRDAENNLLDSKSAFVGPGEQTILLGFQIDIGSGYTLNFADGAPLIKNTSGANYPYSVFGICEITGTTSSTLSTTFSYFYDWQIEYGIPCGRIPISVPVSQDTFTAEFHQSRDIVLVPGSTEVSFTDLSAGAVNWFWDFGDGGTSELQDPVHNFMGLGNYQVTLSAEGPQGCFDNAIDTVIVQFGTVSTAENNIISNFELAPNPASERVWIAIDLEKASAIVIDFVAASGEVVISKSYPSAEQFEIQEDLSGLQAGMYFVQVKTRESTGVHKLILTR